MDVLLLSRFQFAITAAFHFIFPALSIGMAWLNVVFYGKYIRSGKTEDLKLAYFWINLFILTFVMGVATGIVMVFQFGTNWADYVRFVGDIFGAPLAAEAVLAFFLEATFIGVLVWGRDKVSQKLYFVSCILVAFGATLSAFWIIVANSWQQTPAGYILIEGRPILNNFMAALLNPSTLPRYLHTVDACIIAGALFIAGLSAWLLLYRKEHKDIALKSMRVALLFLLLASIAQFAFGHIHSIQVAQTQPAKLAAMEGLFETEAGAPMLLFGIPDINSGIVRFSIGIPKMLSYMAHGDSNAEVLGLNAFPKDEWPPINSTFYSFRIMVYLGVFFALLGFVGLFLLKKDKLADTKWFLKILTFSTPLGVIAAELGWMSAELGRQPWVVYNLLRTDQAVSYNVPGVQVMLSILLFTVLFTLLCTVYYHLIKRRLSLGPDAFDNYSHTISKNGLKKGEEQ